MTRKPPKPQAPADAPTEAAPPPPEGAEPPPADGPAPGAKPLGRPSDYTEETAQAICSLLAEGHSLVEIGRMEGMPNPATVYRWVGAREDFRERYARAREAQAEHFMDEIIDIADDARNDWMDRATKDGVVTVLNTEHISRSKERIDARKWVMAKLNPKKYGDKLQLSNDPDNPVGDKHLTVIEVKVQLLEGLGLKKVTDGSGG